MHRLALENQNCDGDDAPLESADDQPDREPGYATYLRWGWGCTPKAAFSFKEIRDFVKCSLTLMSIDSL